MILTGWKEISNHLRYGVRTVQRWELRNGLPVKRVKESPRSPVVADSDELDAWILRRNKLPPGSPESLVDNFQRALELRRELKQNRKEFQVRIAGSPGAISTDSRNETKKKRGGSRPYERKK